MNNRKGVTLIELLVVISIIALLMAILMPILRKAKEQGKAIICKNNLRQIGMAANFYAEAYNQFIPRGTENPTNPTTWFQLLMPFLNEHPPDNDYRSVKMYRCPSYPVKEQALCYVINGWDITKPIGEMPGEDQVTEPTSLAPYKRLATTVYLCDFENGPWIPICTKAHDEGWSRSDVWRLEHLPISNKSTIQTNTLNWVQTKNTGPRVAHKRHGQGCNLLFADWHVGYEDAVNMAAEKGGVRNEDAIDLWRFKK